MHFAIYAIVLAQFAFYSQKAGDENKNRYIWLLNRHVYIPLYMHSPFIGLYSIAMSSILLHSIANYLVNAYQPYSILYT